MIINKYSNNVVLVLASYLNNFDNEIIPKILYKIKNKPLIIYLIENIIKLNPYNIIFIIDKTIENSIKRTINNYISNDISKLIDYIIQENNLGSGNAIMCAKNKLKLLKEKNILILRGDLPFIDFEIMANMLYNLNSYKICKGIYEKPYNYDRVILYNNYENNLNYIKIVTQNNSTIYDNLINTINSGIYAFNIELLLKYLHMLTKNNIEKKYNLSEIIGLIGSKEKTILEQLVINRINLYKILNINNIDILKIIEYRL